MLSYILFCLRFFISLCLLVSAWKAFDCSGDADTVLSTWGWCSIALLSSILAVAVLFVS